MKAVDSPDGYVSTVESYTDQMKELFEQLKNRSDGILFVSSGFVDESKTNPKISPFSGRKSYFTNDRREAFRKAFKPLCVSFEVPSIEHTFTQEEWCSTCLYTDGLHANEKGHEVLFHEVWPYVERWVE